MDSHYLCLSCTPLSVPSTLTFHTSSPPFTLPPPFPAHEHALVHDTQVRWGRRQRLKIKDIKEKGGNSPSALGTSVRHVCSSLWRVTVRTVSSREYIMYTLFIYILRHFRPVYPSLFPLLPHPSNSLASLGLVSHDDLYCHCYFLLSSFVCSFVGCFDTIVRLIGGRAGGCEP